MKETVEVVLLLLLGMLLAMVPAKTETVGKATKGFSFWVTHSLDNVFRNTAPPARPIREISLLAAGGEFESGQVVIVPHQSLQSIVVRAGDLTGPGGRISHRRIACRFVDYIRIPRNSPQTPAEELLRPAPDWFPDPLLEARSVPGKTGVNRPLLVTVSVPRNKPAGVYTGQIRIQADGASVNIPLSVEVLPFNLPKKPSLWVTNWFGPHVIALAHQVPQYSEPFWKLLEAYAREMSAHRQNVIEVEPSLVQVFIESEGQLSFDFSIFDRWVDIFTRAGVAERLEIMHLAGRSGDVNSPFVVHRRLATVRKTGEMQEIQLEQFLPALVKHLREKGWLKKSLLHIADEPWLSNLDSYLEISRRVRKIAPELPQIDALQIPKGLPGDLQVWVPMLDYFNENYAAFHTAQAKGECELWTYTCMLPQGKYPNRMIDYPLIKTRLLHWINFLYGATGYLHWGLNWWNEGVDIGQAKMPVGDAWDEALDLTRSGLPPGDAFIIYPGTNGPRSSLRYEAMRDGLEDYEYFKLLAQKRGDNYAKAICRQMVRAIEDYDKDPQKLLRLRRKMAKDIIAAH
jgi:hypothetical protein